MKGKTALVVLVASVVLYIMDIVSDIYVAVKYYKNGELWWCIITLIFVLVPHTIINTYAAFMNVSFLWVSPSKAFIMWIFQVSVLASFHQEFLRWKREYWKNNNAKGHQHSADVTLTMHHTFLTLAEAFAESAPQCCLQNYIMVRQWLFPWYTVASTMLSLLSLAWSITSLETSCKTCQWLKKKQENAEKLSFPKQSLIMFFAAHLFLLTSRLTSLVIFAYVFRYHVFVVVGVHWLLAFAGICLGKKKFDASTRVIRFTTNGSKTDIKDRMRLTLILNASLRAYPMVFCLSSSMAKVSFPKNVSENFKAFVFIFYGVLLSENAVMALYAVFGKATKSVVHIDLLAKVVLPLVFGGFILGVLFLFLYYNCCHPGEIVTQGDHVNHFKVKKINSISILNESVQENKLEKEDFEVKPEKCFVNEALPL